LTSAFQPQVVYADSGLLGQDIAAGCCDVVATVAAGLHHAAQEAGGSVNALCGDLE